MICAVTFSGRSPTVLCALLIAGCGSHQTAPQATGHTTPPSAVHYLDPYSVDDIVASVARAGLPVPNPRDVTSQECPRIGCIHKVNTDTISLMRFPNPGTAQLYAGDTQHRFQVADLVMTFAPAVTKNEQLKYEVAVKAVVE